MLPRCGMEWLYTAFGIPKNTGSCRPSLRWSSPSFVPTGALPSPLWGWVGFSLMCVDADRPEKESKPRGVDDK